ncbi:MAG: tyrosine-protein kinase family protein [Ktedonobacterales bacterium]|nr:tyrosine-protein kinase family protein [Ktedonobacterales bacterium]
MSISNEPVETARCVAVAQEHRGHGASTAAYYLARVLVSEGLRVLLVDLTGRRQRLHTLIAHGPMKNLVLWSPPIARPTDLGPLLTQARRETAGKVDVLLVDADAALLERADALNAGVDYVVVVTESSEGGQAAADRIAERLRDELPPLGHVGVVFSRMDAPLAEDLPEKTDRRGLPVLGYYPADYLLAAGDDYSLKGSEPSWPHDTYLYALLRLGRSLIRLVPLHRVTLGMSHLPDHPPPTLDERHDDEARRMA